MNDATIATYDGYHSKTRLDNRADQSGCVLYLFDATDGADNKASFDPHSDRQVREDKGFYIPDILSDEPHDARQEAYSAAMDRAKHLRKAERLVGDAMNLVGLLLVSLNDESDSRAMQIDTALRVIEKKLGNAYNGIDRHDRRHTNLFLAYFDLKGRADDVEQD